MSYNSKVYNVMIASPSDVPSERTIIRDVIYEWNAVHSEQRNIVLMPIGWESHSSPEMGGPPQSIINKQILDKCDLLVGVFWTRLGTPTSQFASGTVEEIEKHILLNKPTMLYFSSQPVALETVDMEQLKDLNEFKSSCQNRGLFESYENQGDFKEKFYRHLQLKINEHDLFVVEAKTDSPSIVDSKTPFPQLSNEARILLKEVSLDRNGLIAYINVVGGTHIQTNGKNLIASNERREIARWESALKELTQKALVETRGVKGEVFQITNLGYQIADMIQM